MGLIHRNSLEPFITLLSFFSPRVVIDFFQTMTSRGEPHLTALHFTINGRQGMLRATDIVVAFQLPVALTNSMNFRQWPHPSPRDMVWVLSRHTSTSAILFRRQLPSGMLLVDHVVVTKSYM